MSVVTNDGIETKGGDAETEQPRELTFSVYHTKGGPESAKRIRVRPRDASDRLPSTDELKELILVRLGQMEAEAFDSLGSEAAAKKVTSTWRLRNVTQGTFIPEVGDTGEVIARGDLLELMDRGVAGGDGS